MKFTKEEKIAFVKRYQDGETVIKICNENQTIDTDEKKEYTAFPTIGSPCIDELILLRSRPLAGILQMDRTRSMDRQCHERRISMV